MLEILEDTGRKIVMKNSKKYRHKKSETNQKTGDGIPYSKPDSRPFLHFFLRTNYFTLIIGLNFSESVG